VAAERRVRAFFGLPLPEPHREKLDRYVAACAALAPEFRWTPADNLHLTVRFLGHVDQGLAERIMDRLAGLGLRAFDLRLGEVGAFKRGRLARVVWLGLASGMAEVGALASAVEAESVRAGLEADKRSYHAHLTLARARGRDGAVLPELPGPPGLPAWRADELILYRSHLGRGGSVYEALRRLSLG
jgi:RNA 2',3'-cyclic 3'-phosphodiesterase